MARLVSDGVVGWVQVHACTDGYFRQAADLGAPTIRAYIVRSAEDVAAAASSEADLVLLDAGMGGGRAFDWALLEDAGFPYMLSGGLDPVNVREAVRRLDPFGVDVSSGVETDGSKDPAKMTAFVYAARGDFGPKCQGELRKRFRSPLQELTPPVSTSYIAPRTSMPRSSPCSAKAFRIDLTVFIVLRALALSGSLSSPMASEILPTMPSMYPSACPHMAASTAPQRVWPRTTTRGHPRWEHAYSTLPRMLESTTLPATRITNRSPIPHENIASGISRESEQQTTTAKGCCPSAAVLLPAEGEMSPISFRLVR